MNDNLIEIRINFTRNSQMNVSEYSNNSNNNHNYLFQDMTPKITKQTKVLIRDKKTENVNKNSSKFEIMTDPLPTVC